MAQLDKARFGQWAIITDASSKIDKEFARQVAASDINIVLVARRETLLHQINAELSRIYGVEHRVVVTDLSKEGFLRRLASTTDGLNVGLVVSNAGTANPEEFLKLDRGDLARLLRLNSLAHMEIAHHFGPKLVKRNCNGILLCGAISAVQSVPFMANESDAKSYVQNFGKALHAELSRRGVNVSVLIIGPTQTAIIEKIGFDPTTMPMKPMRVEQCIFEGLETLRRNRATHLSERINRIMNALIPAQLSRGMMYKMMAKALTNRAQTTSTL